MTSKRRPRRGKGLVNKLISSLPFEAHVPGYNFLGPGTKLQKRLARGDTPINGLDAAAREHDISYSKTKDTKERNKADLVLADQAWERVKAKDSSLGERVAAYAVTNAMKLKAKLGMGCGVKKKPVTKKRKVGAGMKKVGVRKKKVGVRKKKVGAGARRKPTKKKKKKKKIGVTTRIIPIPKTGGKLKSVLTKIGIATRSLAPTMKKIRSAVVKRTAGTQVGQGLYLRPYRTGYGLYLRPWAPDLN